MFAYSDWAVLTVSFVVLSLALSGVAFCARAALGGAKWRTQICHLSACCTRCFRWRSCADNTAGGRLKHLPLVGQHGSIPCLHARLVSSALADRTGNHWHHVHDGAILGHQTPGSE